MSGQPTKHSVYVCSFVYESEPVVDQVVDQKLVGAGLWILLQFYLRDRIWMPRGSDH